MYVEITTREGVTIGGTLEREYRAFEGGMRYIVRTSSGEYRCVKDSYGNYIEYVA